MAFPSAFEHFWKRFTQNRISMQSHFLAKSGTRWNETPHPLRSWRSSVSQDTSPAKTDTWLFFKPAVWVEDSFKFFRMPSSDSWRRSRPVAQRRRYHAYLSIIPAIWPLDWLTDEAFCRHSIIQPSVLSLRSVLKLPACSAPPLCLSLSPPLLLLFEDRMCSKCFLSSSVAPVVSVCITDSCDP